MVLDKESRIIDINENFSALLRIARKDAIGKNISYLKSPEVDVREFISTLSALHSQESERIVSFRIKDAGERIFKQKSIPSVFDDGAKGLTIILSDVTEEILREREIREREEQFRMMAENIQDGLIIMESDKCTFVNRRVAEITGYTFEELWAMDPMAIIAPEDRKKMEPIMELRKKPAQGVTEFQGRIRRKNGVHRDVYIRTTSLKHEETWFAFVIMTDITELRAKDAALFESEQRFRMMAENIQDVLFIIENDQLVYSNRRLSEITGYTKEELLTKNPKDLIAPEDNQRIEELYKKSLAGPEPPAHFQSWLRCKNGERRYVYGHINTVRHGETLSTYITITDVTEFAKREQELLDRIRALERSSGHSSGH